MTGEPKHRPSAPTVAAALARSLGATLHPRYETVSAAELEGMLASANPPTVVDVRLAEDHAAGHIDGALNVPFATFADHRHTVPRGGPVVTVCYRGMLSRTAAQQLAGDGHTPVLNLDGGMRAWDEHAAGGPVG